MLVVGNYWTTTMAATLHNPDLPDSPEPWDELVRLWKKASWYERATVTAFFMIAPLLLVVYLTLDLFDGTWNDPE